VRGESIFEGALTVFGNTTFKGKVTVSGDSAGMALIPSLAKTVEVPFVAAYDAPPIVTISLVMNEATDSAFLSEGVKAAVASVTKNGFTIMLDQPAPRELMYNWFAFAVTDGRRIVGKSPDGSATQTTVINGANTLGISNQNQVTTSGPVPTPVIMKYISPTPVISVSPENPPVQLLAPTLIPSPTATPVMTPVKPQITILPNDLGFVRMRADATPDSEVLAEIPAGTVLEYTDTLNDWDEVTFGGLTGWVSDALVRRN
jgi:hypothetical protein